MRTAPCSLPSPSPYLSIQIPPLSPLFIPRIGRKLCPAIFNHSQTYRSTHIHAHRLYAHTGTAPHAHPLANRHATFLTTQVAAAPSSRAQPATACSLSTTARARWALPSEPRSCSAVPPGGRPSRRAMLSRARCAPRVSWAATYPVDTPSCTQVTVGTWSRVRPSFAAFFIKWGCSLKDVQIHTGCLMLHVYFMFGTTTVATCGSVEQ